VSNSGIIASHGGRLTTKKGEAASAKLPAVNVILVVAGLRAGPVNRAATRSPLPRDTAIPSLKANGQAWPRDPFPPGALSQRNVLNFQNRSRNFEPLTMSTHVADGASGR
jgi:hypothetical protein